MTAANSPQTSFHTTRWTQVRQAKADSDDGRKALADLCDAYYEPVVAYLRSVLRDADAARDMSHAFFAEVLAGGAIRTVDREHGRFRSYLLGAVKHFLSHQREAARSLKRGGGVVPVSLDEDVSAIHAIPDAQALSPEAEFDRQWALTVLAQAMKILRTECAAEGKVTQFETLKPWLMGDAVRGDQAALAAACGMGVSALKMAIQRLRQRFRECLQAEIAATLDDAAMVEEEMRALQAALAS
jgi:DNA-directed RNA polymerase specialized sigma24 family protein